MGTATVEGLFLKPNTGFHNVQFEGQRGLGVHQEEACEITDLDESLARETNNLCLKNHAKNQVKI